MRILLWPFFSQQNKLTDKFLLSTCGACKQLAFLAEKLQEAGHDVLVVLPRHSQRDSAEHPFKCWAYPVYVPPSNPVQRVHWDTRQLQVAEGCDVVVCNHELLALPLRAVCPKAKLIQMCSVKVEPLFYHAWDAADLVVLQGEYAEERAQHWTRTRCTHWSLAFDEREWPRGDPAADRLLPVVFLQRCSASNYTHHLQYLEAMRHRTVFTDVTSYLRAQRPDLEYSSPETYRSTLYSAKVAVSLYDSDYGGLSVREAIRAGCVPVVPRCPAAMRLLGVAWPCYCDPERPESIAAAVELALKGAPYSLDVSNESYQASWGRVKHDICS